MMSKIPDVDGDSLLNGLNWLKVTGEIVKASIECSKFNVRVVVDVHVSVVVLLVVATVEVIVGVHVVVVVDLVVVVVVLDRVVGNVVGTFVVVPTVVVITLPNSDFSKSIFVVIGFCVTGKGAAVAGLAIQNGIVVFGIAGISVLL